jgi:hypothetical protein
MKVLIGLIVPTLATLELGLLGGIADKHVTTDPQSSQAKAQESRDVADPNRVLLDSLGAVEGTTLIREYVQKNGDLGRQYASALPIDLASRAVTLFYRDKLRNLGWETLQEHAAVSAYQKGTQVVAVLRDGPEDPGLPPGAKLLKSATAPGDAKFFFAIEAGPKR